MFKAPDRNYPREWGQQRQTPLPLATAIAPAVVGFLVLCAFIPYGPEIALAVGGIASPSWSTGSQENPARKGQ